jgi:hypothetical protein
LWGFSGQGLTNDYRGYFVGTSLGVSASIFNQLGFEAGPAFGWGQFTGTGDTPFGAVTGRGVVSGDVAYFSLGASVNKSLFATGSRLSKALKLPIDASLTGTWYTPDGPVVNYVGLEEKMVTDVWRGDNSPVKYVPLILATGLYDPDLRLIGATVGANVFVKNGWIAPAK